MAFAQPLATAPKDGTRILAWDDIIGDWVIIRWAVTRWVNSFDGSENADCTHWQNLPEALD